MRRKQVNPVVEANENKFQNAWDLYWHQETTKEGQTKRWQEMLESVYFCCLNLAKTRAYGVRIDDLEGKALDATMNIMTRIAEGCHPLKLSSFCFLYTIGQVYAMKHRRWEDGGIITAFEDTFDNMAYTVDPVNNNVVLNKDQFDPIEEIIDDTPLYIKTRVWKTNEKGYITHVVDMDGNLYSLRNRIGQNHYKEGEIVWYSPCYLKKEVQNDKD